MMFLPRAVKVYVATAPCNLRRSFDGLSNEVREVLAKDALSGHVFVFLNRRKVQVKLLLRRAAGSPSCTETERGTFSFADRVANAQRRVDVHELSMLLEGIDVRHVRASQRWEPPAHARTV
jgi:transposase